VRITLRHHFDFGADRELVGDDLVRPEAWDALRTRTDGAFALPADRTAWEATADAGTDIAKRARAIDAVLAERAVGTLASYGVGVAALELWLHRLAPHRGLTLTDFGPATVERLTALFPDAEVHRHDLLRDAPLPADLHLFHRIDTEFDDDQYRAVLERFRAVPVLVVATEVIGLRRAAAELRKRVRPRRITHAGYIRTRAAFESLWDPTHSMTPLRLHDLDGWLLEPRG
jgi:hypothetical protein